MYVQAPFIHVGRLRIHFLHIAGLLVPLILWEAAAHYLAATNPFGESLFPSIERVFTVSLPGFATFSQRLGVGEPIVEPSYGPALKVLGSQSLITLVRLLVGTSLGIFLGVVVGLATGWSRSFRHLVELPIGIIRMVPSLALLPLFLLWFGGREIGATIFITLAVFMLLVVATMNAIGNIPRIYFDYAETLGATKSQVYRTVVAPAIFPGLIGSVRVALASSWAITLGAEFLAVQSGLGRMMQLSEMFFFTGRIMIVAILFILYSLVLNGIYLFFARRLTRWQP